MSKQTLRRGLWNKLELAFELEVNPITIDRWEADPTKSAPWGKTYVGRTPYWVPATVQEWIKAGGIRAPKKRAAQTG
jgi:hypothetical protein